MSGAIQEKKFTLNTGAKIPAIGFGTWKAGPGEAGAAVKAAFEAGYRHFVRDDGLNFQRKEKWPTD